MAEESAVDDSTLLSQITAREGEVEGYLAKKDKVNALKTSLQNPPVDSKSSQVKVSNMKPSIKNHTLNEVKLSFFVRSIAFIPSLFLCFLSTFHDD